MAPVQVGAVTTLLWSLRSRPCLRRVPRSSAVPALWVAGRQDVAAQGTAGAPCGELTAAGTAPSHLDQTRPSELPGHPQAGREQAPAACSVRSRPLCAPSVCLSVCPAASPRTFPSGRSACQRLHQLFSCIPPAARRTSGFADALLVFLESPKCFRNVSSFFLNNSGDRGLPSALMSLSV